VRLPIRRQVSPVLFVGLGITLLNGVGQWVIARVSGNPAYTVVAGAVGLLLYLYLLNQCLLFGAALIATSRHGQVIDLAAGPPEAAEPPPAVQSAPAWPPAPSSTAVNTPPTAPPAVPAPPLGSASAQPPDAAA
jgi:membrane protein